MDPEPRTQWPRDEPRLGDVKEDAQNLDNGLRDKPVHGYGERDLGRRKPTERRLWERR